MSSTRVGRNDLCPCGSGKKFKHCCHRNSFSNGVPQSRPVPTDGAFLRRGPEPPRRPPPQLKPITRVAVEYAISDALGRAEVTFCYELGTPIIMADGNVLPVEYLKPGMQFRLEDGGIATTTTVEEPKVWQPPSQERDANGNSLRRVIGRVKYTGYFPRFDLGVPGEVLETTPGHLFFSVTRGDWFPAETFRVGERLRNRQGLPVPVEWVSTIRWEFCELYNIEVEEYHTYFVGGGPHGGIWTHNGMAEGCRVPRAASNRMPKADRFPTRDPSGRIHGDIPKSVPRDWRRGEIQDAIAEVQGSLGRRRGNMAIFGEEGGHRARIAQEEAWLRQLLRRLDDLR